MGPHQIAYALERGHSISTFTRGKSKPTVHADLLSKVEMLIGDRANNLKALENRKWDVVIDNSGHNVQWTNDSAELLKENVGLYVYTSSTGVYYPYLNANIREDSKLLMVEPEGITDPEIKLEYWYGAMKSNSELAAQKIFGKERTLVIRPTYMVGPGDKSDRFIHWPIRLGRGGEIMVPGKNTDPVQYIDVRDVASWMIRLIENNIAGVFNAVGPENPTTMQSFIQMGNEAFSNEKSFTVIDDYDFLLSHHLHTIVPWIMPIDNNFGSASINNDLAKNNGLTFTSTQKIVKDTYDWWYSDAISEERRQQVESNPDSWLVKEEGVLEDWKTNR